MSALEIILLVGGVVLFIVSFWIPDKKSEETVIHEQATKDQVQKIVKEEMLSAGMDAKGQFHETVSSTMEESEKTLKQLTNDKMQAITDYSSTVMEDIHKNHDEVIQLFDLLNQKEQVLKEEAAKEEARAKLTLEKALKYNETKEEKISEKSIAENVTKKEPAKEQSNGKEIKQEKNVAGNEETKTAKNVAGNEETKPAKNVASNKQLDKKEKNDSQITTQKIDEKSQIRDNIAATRDPYTNISATALGMRNHLEQTNPSLTQKTDEFAPVSEIEMFDGETKFENMETEPKVITPGLASEIFAQMEKAAGDTVAAATTVTNAAIASSMADASKDVKNKKDSAFRTAGTDEVEAESKTEKTLQDEPVVAEKIVNAFSLFDDDVQEDVGLDHNAEIIRLHKLGKSNAEIANALGISVGEVKMAIDLS